MHDRRRSLALACSATLSFSLSVPRMRARRRAGTPFLLVTSGMSLCHPCLSPQLSLRVLAPTSHWSAATDGARSLTRPPVARDCVCGSLRRAASAFIPFHALASTFIRVHPRAGPHFRARTFSHRRCASVRKPQQLADTPAVTAARPDSCADTMFELSFGFRPTHPVPASHGALCPSQSGHLGLGRRCHLDCDGLS